MANEAIPEHYIRTFETNWNHVVQQEMSALQNRVTVDTFQGKEKLYTDLDSVEFTERTTRLGDTNPQEATASKRKMSKRDFVCAIIFDRKDDEYLGMLGMPKSEIMEAMQFAWRRKIDELIIEGFNATVYGGVEPYVTAITLSNNVAVNYVASGSPANSGLTPDKIIAACKKFELAEVWPEYEELFLVISPKQKEDLQQAVKASPNDVWATQVSEWLQGKSGKLFGMNVILSNQLPHNSGTDVRTCFAYSRRGLYVAGDRMTIEVDKLPEQNHAVQIAAYGDYGVMRRYEERVVEIFCDESP